MQLMQTVIDGFEFARNGNHAGGRVLVDDLLRLKALLAETQGELKWSLQGGRSEGGTSHLEIRIRVEGELTLLCQRCLQALTFPLGIEKRLLLVGEGKDWPEEEVEDEDCDAIEASQEMSVKTLIEDEVLLALPISPRHENCDTPATKGSKQDASPFAVLRQLKID